MKCPYHDCQKDYNESAWSPIKDGFIGNISYLEGRATKNRLYVTTWECRFCGRYFHKVAVGNEVFDEYGNIVDINIESLVSFPVSKTSFKSKNVPREIRDAFNEAERCRSVGSITGVGACLRKAVYLLCEDQKVAGQDYRVKIGNLKVKDGYKELLKQFKWLGDNVTKPGDEKYTTEMIDVALEILPTIIDSMYIEEEKESEAAKMLSRAKSVNPENNVDQ